MAKLDFSEILNQQVGSAPKPQPIPEGTYYGEIVGVPAARIAKTKEGEKPLMAVRIALTEADSDVDADELAEAGGLLNASGDAKVVTKEFWIEESSRYQYDGFLEAMGLSGSYTEAGEQLPGRAVTVFITKDEYQTKSGETRSSNKVSRLFARE